MNLNRSMKPNSTAVFIDDVKKTFLSSVMNRLSHQKHLNAPTHKQSTAAKQSEELSALLGDSRLNSFATPASPMDYYHLLGIKPGETEKSKIRQAAQARIDEIRQAYAVLADPVERETYNESLITHRKPGVNIEKMVMRVWIKKDAARPSVFLR